MQQQQNEQQTPNLTKNSPFPPDLPAVQQNYAVSEHQAEQSLITYNHITYALAVFSYFTAGLTWIIPIVMNYAKRDEARHTWLYSHFDWQIKTFWYSIFFGGIGLIMMIFGFGVAFLGLVFDNVTLVGHSSFVGVLGVVVSVVVIVWHFYRMVRGWVALSNRKAVP